MMRINIQDECRKVALRVADSLRPNIILGPDGVGIHLHENEYFIYYMTGLESDDLNMVIRIPAGIQ